MYIYIYIYIYICVCVCVYSNSTISLIGTLGVGVEVSKGDVNVGRRQFNKFISLTCERCMMSKIATTS